MGAWLGWLRSGDGQQARPFCPACHRIFAERQAAQLFALAPQSPASHPCPLRPLLNCRRPAAPARLRLTGCPAWPGRPLAHERPARHGIVRCQRPSQVHYWAQRSADERRAHRWRLPRRHSLGESLQHVTNFAPPVQCHLLCKRFASPYSAFFCGAPLSGGAPESEATLATLLLPTPVISFGRCNRHAAKLMPPSSSCLLTSLFCSNFSAVSACTTLPWGAVPGARPPLRARPAQDNTFYFGAHPPTTHPNDALIPCPPVAACQMLGLA